MNCTNHCCSCRYQGSNYNGWFTESFMICTLSKERIYGNTKACDKFVQCQSCCDCKHYKIVRDEGEYDWDAECEIDRFRDYVGLNDTCNDFEKNEPVDD